MQYAAVEPFGFEGADAHNALLATVVARSMGSKDARVEDFSLRREAEVQLTPEMQEAWLTAAFVTPGAAPTPQPAEVSAPGEKMATNGHGQG